MAGKIKGITIEIGGNVQPLNKALEGVNKKSRDLQGELRHVERLLKLDPKNTELLAQKQKLLAEAVSNTREKLDTLREAQKQVQQQFERGEASEEQYRALQREIIQTEQDLKKLTKQLKATGDGADKMAKDFKTAGEKLKGVGTKMATYITAPILAGFALVTQGTKELRGDLARLETNAQMAGQGMEPLNEAMAKLYGITGEVDSNVEGLSNLLATGFRDEQLTKLLDSLYGAAIKFSDTLKFEGISDGLQETLATGQATGPFAELLERSGVNLDHFNEGLATAIKRGEEENYILQVLARTGLAETYEAYRKNNEGMVEAAESTYELQTALAELGKTLEPLLTPLIKFATELLTAFNELEPEVKNVIFVLVGVAAVLGPLLIIVGQVITAISAIGPIVTGIGAAIGAVAAGPILLILGAIALLVAAFLVVRSRWDEIMQAYKDAYAWLSTTFIQWWEGFVEFWSGVWNALKNLVVARWNEIIALLTAAKDHIVGVFNSARKGILNIWSGIADGIKGFINKIISAINGMISGMNKLKWNAPDWVPIIGGKSWGVSIPKIPYLAEGGDILKAGAAIVGERGPELLHLPQGAKVTPLKNAAQDVNINVDFKGLPANIDERTLKSFLVKIIQEPDIGHKLDEVMYRNRAGRIAPAGGVR